MSTARPTNLETLQSASPARRDDNVRSAEAFVAGLLRITRKRLGTVELVMLCVVTVAIAVACLIPVSYTGTAEVIFNPRKSNGIDPASSETEVAVDPVSIQNQIYILTSRSLAAHVVDRLDLTDDPEFSPKRQVSAPYNVSSLFARNSGTSSGAGSRNDRVIDTFLKHLSVQPLGLSTTLEIAFSSRNPKTASTVANALADAYIERQLDTKSASARVAASWLTQRVRQLALDTQRAEAVVQHYKRANGISEVTNGISESAVSTPLIDQELVALQAQLVQARANLAEKSATRAGLQALMATGSSADLSKISDSPEIVQLRLQEADVLQKEADLKARYGPKHPKMLAVIAERKDIENKIALEVDRLARAVDNDVDIARAQVASLEDSLRRTEEQASNENMARATLQSLEANAKSTRAAYEAFVARLRDMQGQEAMQLPDASIISRAPIPTSPNPPSRSLIVLASLPVGFLLGLLIVLFRERGTGAAPANARSTAPVLSAPVLAEIPDLAGRGWTSPRIAKLAITDPSSSFVRSINLLENRIPRSAAKPGYVIGICSLTPSDGNSLVTINLARSAAQNGRRVIAVDADRAGRIAQLLGPGSGISSLSDIISGQSSLNASAVRDCVPNVYILSGGLQNAGPGGLPDSGKIRDFLDHLRNYADLVILNLPTLSGPSNEMVQIYGSVDGLIILLGWNREGLPTAAEINAYVGRWAEANIGLVVAV